MTEQPFNSRGEYIYSWYCPPVAAAPAAKKKKLPVWATILIILGAILVLCCVVLVGLQLKVHGSLSVTSSIFSSDSPSPSAVPANPKDYFESYFEPYDDSEECLIPKVTAYPGISIEVREHRGETLTLQDLYERCAPSIIAIEAYISPDNDESYHWGSGIILTEDGYIVTNAHIIEGTSRASVILWNDERYDALLVGYDSRSDVAVLKIEASGLQPAEFSSDSYFVGDSVAAIGNPLGNTFRSSMTTGIISGIDRSINSKGTTLTLMQISAPINEGNSGGPLFNMYGQVIGITNMKMSASYTGAVTIEGIGFAIPTSTVKEMADGILRNGAVLGRPALGLTLGKVSQFAAETYTLPDGLYVSAVSAGSDAETKGIQVGSIITAVDGQPVNSTDELLKIIQMHKIGDALHMTVWCDGEYTEMDILLVDVNDVYK